ncbi:MAG: peroxiredoxin (alkyl hydroperoxide reductase subunit C) [Chlamydiales bacterium]|jgi:peroxiredoxin (alkyl hydroperoxide reductase subunit C)
MRNINEALGVDLPYPVTEDLSMSIAKAYGMLQPGTRNEEATRATFIIDPSGILRLSLHYCNASGRTIEQMMQIVEVIQNSEGKQQHTTTPGQGVARDAHETAGPADTDSFFPMRTFPTA